MKKKRRGKIIIISGPSGSGKTSLYRDVLKNKKIKSSLVETVSYTTREKRKGERQGRDYFFISKKMFLYKERCDHFLESQKVFNNYYGTPLKQVKEILSRGKNVLLCIDVRGAKIVIRKVPDVLKVFIQTKNMTVLKTRLNRRGSDKKKDIAIRLKEAGNELKEANKYDHVIINDDFSKASKELQLVLEQVI